MVIVNVSPPNLKVIDLKIYLFLLIVLIFKFDKMQKIVYTLYIWHSKLAQISPQPCIKGGFVCLIFYHS